MTVDQCTPLPNISYTNPEDVELHECLHTLLESWQDGLETAKYATQCQVEAITNSICNLLVTMLAERATDTNSGNFVGDFRDIFPDK